MITKFNYINVGSPSGVFNRIAYDCIELAKEHKCDVVWYYRGAKLAINSKDNLASVEEKLYEYYILKSLDLDTKGLDFDWDIINELVDELSNEVNN